MQLVIAAITTWPLSSSVSVPSASVSLALVETPPLVWVATGSLAGNESASASSSSPVARQVVLGPRARTICLEAVSGTRSWGRLGPAMLGTTVARSRCSTSRVGRLLRVLVVPEAVGLGVRLDQLDLLLAGGR